MGCVATVFSTGQQRSPGPGWEKVGDGYEKTAGIKARTSSGAVINWTLPLTHGGDILIAEHLTPSDELTVDCRKDGRFSFSRDKNGKHTSHFVRFGDVSYRDLDGDGVFDVMCDTRINNNWYIICQKRGVRVSDMSRGFKTPPFRTQATELDDKAFYRFEKGEWHREAPDKMPEK
jgi:hypothetical protein